MFQEAVNNLNESLLGKVEAFDDANFNAWLQHSYVLNKKLHIINQVCRFVDTVTEYV